MEKQLNNIPAREETAAEATAHETTELILRQMQKTEDMLKQRIDNHFIYYRREFNGRLTEIEDSQTEFNEDLNRVATRFFVMSQELTQLVIRQPPLQQPFQQPFQQPQQPPQQE